MSKRTRRAATSPGSDPQGLLGLHPRGGVIAGGEMNPGAQRAGPLVSGASSQEVVEHGGRDVGMPGLELGAREQKHAGPMRVRRNERLQDLPRFVPISAAQCSPRPIEFGRRPRFRRKRAVSGAGVHRRPRRSTPG